ncbi:MAG: hypothetical protein RLZZ385_603 [Pseudomonadota bacterium]|jgi:uncharacterized iron-regulated protein
MMKLCGGFGSILLALLLSLDSAVAHDDLNPAWQSPLLRDHPLVGRIWDQQAQQFISPEELLAAAAAARFLLLGEKHDNPDHHSLQRALLSRLLQASPAPLLSFEMLDSSQTPVLAQLRESGPGTLEELRSALSWDEEGWDWAFYGPLIHDALSAGITVRAGNISREEMGQVYREPLDAAVAAVLGEAALTVLNNEIDVSHCGQLPASQFPAMVRVQQSRDFAMAGSLSAPAEAGQRILIAGNFHIRQDLGVPAYLVASGAAADLDEVVSLALLEVSAESEVPTDYVEGQDGLSAYDYVWFTPMLTDEDYCAAFL